MTVIVSLCVALLVVHFESVAAVIDYNTHYCTWPFESIAEYDNETVRELKSFGVNADDIDKCTEEALKALGEKIPKNMGPKEEQQFFCAKAKRESASCECFNRKGLLNLKVAKGCGIPYVYGDGKRTDWGKVLKNQKKTTCG